LLYARWWQQTEPQENQDKERCGNAASVINLTVAPDQGLWVGEVGGEVRLGFVGHGSAAVFAEQAVKVADRRIEQVQGNKDGEKREIVGSGAICREIDAGKGQVEQPGS